ncbi:leucine-rich repeat domain-containing protein [Chloropicon primus]|uniref:Leucine-rich repeat domain-containing protein n=1 Tax=Chloropicon primus TaxID=1764295 RepID=A0A5B8MDU4_9CHLO|nr:leucine-rich repeat domain-containing protein [Chloropicon primus]UPQ96739.1 leucine-rich repeat domain-containing protein [Chloropicon primus]|eukprot:QDZ17520.1 leucine-rich repeat domain-containing protein [Chloropicon primus]
MTTTEGENKGEGPEEVVTRGLCDIGRTADGLKQSFLTIDVRGFGLETVAPVSKYQHLQRLKLANNRLKTLQGLGSLNNVVYIDASENELTDLLDMTPPLCNVSEANFSLNRITQIKTDLECYKCLKVVNLDNNGLTSLEGLQVLIKLQILSASGNALSSCSGINKLNQLRVLDVSNNNIEKVTELKDLCSLEILNLSQNKVTSLDSADQLESLTLLDISDNHICILEDFCLLSKLSKLREIKMKGNPCCLAMNSRLHVVKILTQLAILNGEKICVQEKVEAQNLHGADIDDLEAIRRKYFPNGELDDGGNANPPVSAQLKAFEGILDAREYFGSFDDRCKAVMSEANPDVEDLCGLVLEISSSSMEMCRALYLWVVDAVQHPNSKHGSMDTTAPLFKDSKFDVLGDFQGTWAERVSQLFVLLAQGCELLAEVIIGYGRSPDSASLAVNVPNHCWAAICIDGKWCLLDCTWKSFCAPPFAFFMQHFPLQRRWQLRPELKTITDFWEMPRYSADFALLGLEIDGPIQSNVSLNFGSTPYCFTLDVPQGLIVRTELCDSTGEEVFWKSGASTSFHNIVESNTRNGMCKTRIYTSPPRGGDFLLLVFVTSKAAREAGKAPHSALSVKVSCLDIQQDNELMTYPLPNASELFSSRLCSLVSPLDEPMLTHRETEFAALVPGASRAWLQQESTSEVICELASSTDECFTGNFIPIEEGSLSLYAEYPGSEDSSLLLKFYPLSLTAIMLTETEKQGYEEIPESEELASLRETFRRVDKNGDGRVNKADLLLAMKKDPELSSVLRLQKSAVRAGDGSMQEFEDAFEGLDRDQSGDLDWHEFSVLVQEPR